VARLLALLAAGKVCKAGMAVKTKFTSLSSKRQAELPLTFSERCTKALALKRCQSSGTRWPLATASTFSLWRMIESKAGPNFTASSNFDNTRPRQFCAS
jgi:hypothetical protein